MIRPPTADPAARLAGAVAGRPDRKAAEVLLGRFEKCFFVPVRGLRQQEVVLARRASKKDTARAFAIQAARIAVDGNAEDITVLDLRGVSPVTDYFVICTGTSTRQMRTVADDAIAYGRSIGERVWQVAGMEAADWIVLDFVDVVVHIFDQVRRRRYDLELIWGEAPRVRWRAAARKPRTRR